MATTPAASSARDLDLLTSVAGEEDPGASVDLAASPGSSDQPAGGGANQAPTPQAPMAPGDQAPPGTPSTGENVCPQCGGTGQLGGKTCPHCEGTGKVIVGIGGA